MSLEKIFGHTGFQCVETTIDGGNTYFDGKHLVIGILPPEKGYAGNILIDSRFLDEFMKSFGKERTENKSEDISQLSGQKIYAYYISRTLLGVKKA